VQAIPLPTLNSTRLQLLTARYLKCVRRANVGSGREGAGAEGGAGYASTYINYQRVGLSGRLTAFDRVWACLTAFETAQGGARGKLVVPAGSEGASEASKRACGPPTPAPFINSPPFDQTPYHACSPPNDCTHPHPQEYEVPDDEESACARELPTPLELAEEVRARGR
jgi:hypothetical protein